MEKEGAVPRLLNPTENRLETKGCMGRQQELRGWEGRGEEGRGYRDRWCGTDDSTKKEVSPRWCLGALGLRVNPFHAEGPL